MSVVSVTGIAKATHTPEPVSHACVDCASTLIPIHQQLKFGACRRAIMGNILNINEIMVDNSIVSNDLMPSYLPVCLCALSKQNGEVADARYIRNHRNLKRQV